MDELNSALDRVISTIKESDEYKKCLELREKMKDNEDITLMIENVKRLQKEYVKSGYSEDTKKKLDEVVEKLNQIPLYVMYNQELDKVNIKIDYVRESLNDYFYQLLNEKNDN